MQEGVQLPNLPSNAQYVYYGDKNCRGWGSMAWFLTENLEILPQYQYFIFLDSAVRGPFLPAYYQVSQALSYNAM
jgi:hypothetical protein